MQRSVRLRLGTAVVQQNLLAREPQSGWSLARRLDWPSSCSLRRRQRSNLLGGQTGNIGRSNGFDLRACNSDNLFRRQSGNLRSGQSSNLKRAQLADQLRGHAGKIGRFNRSNLSGAEHSELRRGQSGNLRAGHGRHLSSTQTG